MRQIITRMDAELAAALKRRAREAGESVNSLMNRLVRDAVGDLGPGRESWKQTAIGDGRLLARGGQDSRRRGPLPPRATQTTKAGYAARLVSSGRDER